MLWLNHFKILWCKQKHIEALKPYHYVWLIISAFTVSRKRPAKQQIIAIHFRYLETGEDVCTQTSSECPECSVKLTTVCLSCCFQTCLHSLCTKFPPSVKYRRLFISELIRQVGPPSLKFVLGAPGSCMCCQPFGVCVPSTAGGRGLRPSGRAVRRSGQGAGSWRHARLLQELLTGT